MVTGEQIKAKRLELGLSVRTLAKRLNIVADNIYKWEKGTKPSDPDDYKKIEIFVLGEREDVENFPNILNDPETSYGNGNMAALIRIIENQQGVIKNQQETIHLLVTGSGRKKAS